MFKIYFLSHFGSIWLHFNEKLKYLCDLWLYDFIGFCYFCWYFALSRFGFYALYCFNIVNCISLYLNTANLLFLVYLHLPPVHIKCFAFHGNFPKERTLFLWQWSWIRRLNWITLWSLYSFGHLSLLSALKKQTLSIACSKGIWMSHFGAIPARKFF